MPAITIGGVVASILQFVVVIGILIPVLVTHTNTGYYVLPGTYLTHLNGTVNQLNQTYINPTGSNSLQQEMSGINQANQQNSTVSALSSFGGLAFIPAAYNVFINDIFPLAGTVVYAWSSIFNTGSGSILDIASYISIALISAAFTTYMIVIFAMKLMTPISKTEIEDV